MSCAAGSIDSRNEARKLQKCDSILFMSRLKGQATLGLFLFSLFPKPSSFDWRGLPAFGGARGDQGLARQRQVKVRVTC
jgi:hypothetical protein